MIISIASGKGGTGKTTVATSLALSLKEKIQFLDCDVEEPNAHIFLKPEFLKEESVKIEIPEIDFSKCDFCGKCAEICAFNSIIVFKEKVLIFENLCHSCGGCKLICSKGAISYKEREIGIVKEGNFNGSFFINGILNLKEPMPTPVIEKVKKHIKEEKIVIIDSPTGTSCPMIKTVIGSDFCILVTEPTPFGLNDLKLAVDVLRKLKIPFGVIINLVDLGDDKVEKYCKDENIDILLKIPFNRKISNGYSQGISLVDVMPEYKEKFKNLFKKIKGFI